MRMDKYGRELDLILLLTENKSYTAQEIADRLDITRRNLYYYFDYLRDCGFELIKSGYRYRLSRNAHFFRKLHENISLNDNEAAMLYRLLDSADKNDYMAQTVKVKLGRMFNLGELTDPALVHQTTVNARKLREAIDLQKMVTLKDYSSPHSKTVSDRIVEPFLLMNNSRDIRCYELRAHANKTFKLSRMGSVEIMDVPWIHEQEHKEVYTDIFMFSGEERHHIILRLGQLSHNLLLEEYPHSESMVSNDGEGFWRFETDVVSFLGIGRFVLGLYTDIQVLGSDEFRHYLQEQIAQYSQPR
jgi:predicted DNA-binding transcriptional regulator YafY